MTLIISLLARFSLTFLMVLLALSGLLMVFDLLANADNVLEYHPGELLPLLQYVALRGQQIINFVLPLSVLIAAMALFARMVLSQEIVILRAVGISVHYILGVLAVATAIIAFAHLSFANLILPHSSATLYYWQQQDYRGTPVASSMKIATDWVASGNQFMHAESVTNQGRSLRGVMLVTRDAQHVIRDYLAADSATYAQGMWTLEGVRELHSSTPGAEEKTSRMRIALPFEPETLSLIGVREEELGYGELLLLMEETEEGNDRSRPYAFWFHRKLAAPFSSFVMLLIAAPMALQLARRNRLLIASFGCIMAGFMFYVVQQLLASLGETGQLPPMLAAWSPMILGAAITNWVVLHYET